MTLLQRAAGQLRQEIRTVRGGWSAALRDLGRWREEEPGDGRGGNKLSGRTALSPAELAVYYRGVYFATVALKSRLAKLGPELRPAVREIGRYQQMVVGFREALAETERHKREQRDPRSRSTI